MIKEDKEKVYKALLDKANYTSKEKLAHKLFLWLFNDEALDLIDDFRGQGFGDGYISGYQQSQLNIKQGQIELYEQGKKDGIKDYLFKLRSVDPDNVIMFDRVGGLYVSGEKVSESESKLLKEEAIYLKNTKIWNLIINTIADQARDVIFKKSKDFEDVKSGKLMLYNLDLIEKIRGRCENYEQIKKESAPIDYGRIAEMNK